MEATFAKFPGTMKRVTVDDEGNEEKTTLQKFLEKAGETFAVNNRSEYAVNGELTTDPNTEVPNGATVTKTERVEGG